MPMTLCKVAFLQCAMTEPNSSWFHQQIGTVILARRLRIENKRQPCIVHKILKGNFDHAFGFYGHATVGPAYTPINPGDHFSFPWGRVWKRWITWQCSSFSSTIARRKPQTSSAHPGLVSHNISEVPNGVLSGRPPASGSPFGRASLPFFPGSV